MDLFGKWCDSGREPPVIDAENPVALFYAGLLLIALMLALSIAVGKWLERSKPNDQHITLDKRGWRTIILLVVFVCVGVFVVQQVYVAVSQTWGS